jgi:putative MATE family efflux protein
LFYSISSAVVIWIIARLGTEQIAAHNVLLRAESLSFMPGIGFTIAAGIVVGQALGEKNPEKARVAAWESIKIGIALMGTMGLIFFLFPRLIVGMFTNDPQVLSIGSAALMVVGIIQPVQALMFVLSGALKGAGDTKTSMIISFCGLWFIRAPFAYLFGSVMGLGVVGVWGGGMCLDIAFRAFLYYRRFLGDKWVKIKV